MEAADALAMGLATKLVSDADLAAETASLAERLASGPTLAYAATKVLMSRELDMDLGSAIEMEAYAQALLMTSRDHSEFYEAFISGRSPEWKGR